MNKIVELMMVISLSGMLFGCGSGGGDSGKSAPNVTDESSEGYPTEKLTSTATGAVYNAELEGACDDGFGNVFEASGSVSIINRGQVQVDGVMVFKREASITMSCAGEFDQIINTFYYDGDGNVVSASTGSPGVTCTQTISNTFPEHVKAGDFGTLSAVSCSDGTSRQTTYTVDESGIKDGLGVNLLTKAYGPSGLQEGQAGEVYVISSTGKIDGYGLLISASNGALLALGSEGMLD